MDQFNQLIREVVATKPRARSSTSRRHMRTLPEGEMSLADRPDGIHWTKPAALALAPWLGELADQHRQRPAAAARRARVAEAQLAEPLPPRPRTVDEPGRSHVATSGSCSWPSRGRRPGPAGGLRLVLPPSHRLRRRPPLLPPGRQPAGHGPRLHQPLRLRPPPRGAGGRPPAALPRLPGRSSRCSGSAASPATCWPRPCWARRRSLVAGLAGREIGARAHGGERSVWWAPCWWPSTRTRCATTACCCRSRW